MKKLLSVLCALMVLVGLVPTAKAEANWRFPVRLTYVQWLLSDRDDLKSFFEGQGYRWEEQIVIPVGLSVAPNVEWNWGGQIGGTVGPLAWIYVQGGPGYSGFDIPLSVWYGQEFLPGSSVSPFIRVGGVYHVGLGDKKWHPDFGYVAAVGVELFRGKNIGMLIEAAYDDVTGAHHTSDGLQISVGAIF